MGNQAISMKITEELNKMNSEELKSFCINNFEDRGIFLINYLSVRFNKEKDENVAIIISILLNTLACYWEGVDFYKIELYENVLKIYPNSVFFLTSILSLGLPPYYGSMNEYFDFEKYKNDLFIIDPENPIFKELEIYGKG
jgi:hypothetical protein